MVDIFKWITNMVKNLEAIAYGGCLVWKVKHNEGSIISTYYLKAPSF